MPYTFVPKQKYAKAFGRDMRISAKSAATICRVIRNKPLVRSRRLLQNLLTQKQNLDGKFYTKTVRGILALLESCGKNAEFLGLDADKLLVHASASAGTILRRRRRKADFGSRIKSTNVEIMLIERGLQRDKVSMKKLKAAKQKPRVEKEEQEMKAAIEEVKEKTEKLQEKVRTE